MKGSPAQLLLEATTLGEAQAACALCVDEALDGACAPSLQAPQVIRDLAAAPSTSTYYAYVLAVLLAIARWLGTWSRVPASGESESPLLQFRAVEQECAALLDSIASRTATEPLPLDAEARSLVYRLWGVAPPNPSRLVSRLKAAIEDEAHREAAACAVEGLVVALARAAGTQHDDQDVVWLVRLIAAGPTAFSRRARGAAHDWTGHDLLSNQSRIRELFGLPAQGSEPGWRWPSELIG